MAKRHYAENYAGIDERREQEHKDGGMIPSGSGSLANMPQEVVMKTWPMENGYLPENLNDGKSGIDAQINLDNSKKRAGFSPKKV